nr:hypothetical protein 3 [bacterium]
MAKRRKPRQGDVETNALANQRWSGLQEQQRLQEQHFTQEENEAARRRTQQLLSGGYGAIDWGDLLALYSEK